MEKQKIVVKQNSARGKSWNNLLDILINDPALSFWRDESGDIRIFLENQSGWCLVLTNHGTWKIE